MNESRNRYYGKRVGDIVKIKRHNGRYIVAEVIEYGFLDNNRLTYKTIKGKEITSTAECSELILKVEDRADYQ